MGPVIGNLGSYKEVGDMAGPVIMGSLAQAASLQVGFAASGLLAGFVKVIRFAIPSCQTLEWDRWDPPRIGSENGFVVD